MADQKLHFIKKPSYKRVGKDMVVQLRYALFDLDRDGEALEFRDDLHYLHGGYGGAFPKVEEALEGAEVGAKVELDLAPEDAFGPRNPALVITGPESDFPPEARQAGVQLDGEAPDGSVVKFVVTDVADGNITVDGNHPLAGRRLRFVLEVADIRKATGDELAAGYAFGASAAAGKPN